MIMCSIAIGAKMLISCLIHIHVPASISAMLFVT